MDEILFPPDKCHQPVVQKQDGENDVLDLGTLGAEGHGIRVFSPTHIFPRQNQRFRFNNCRISGRCRVGTLSQAFLGESVLNSTSESGSSSTPDSGLS